MMFQPLFVRSLTEDEKRQLAQRARSANKEEARRAGVVLLSSEGKTAADIARSLGFHPSNVKKWVRKFNEEGISGIAVRKRGPREGPRPSFTRDQIDRLLELAGTTPGQIGYSFDRWTAQKLANAAVKEGIVDKISHVTVQQILKRNTHGGLSAAQSKELSSHADKLISQARSAYASCRFSQAAEYYKQALEDEKYSAEEEAEIRALLSNAFAESSRFEEAYAAVEKYESGSLLSKLSALTRARIKLRIGWAHSWLRNQAKAIASLNEAKKIFLELQDELGLCEVHHALGRTYIAISEFRIARDHLLTAVQNKTVADYDLLARIYLQLGTVDFYQELHSARDNYLTALSYVRQCPNRNDNLEGMILLNLGASFDEDDPVQRRHAAEYTSRAIECLENSKHKDLPLAYNNLGENLRQSGEWKQAIDSLSSAIKLAQQFNQPNHEATGRATLAEILLGMGLFEEAEKEVEKCIELISGTSDKWLEANALRILAGVFRETGRIEPALGTLRQALRLSTSVGDLHELAMAQVALAETHFLQGGYDQAREYLELAQGRLKEEKSRSLFTAGLIQRLTGELETASGRLAEAKQHLAQSLSIFNTLVVPYDLGKSYYAMGLLLVATADSATAQAQFEQALAIFEKLEARPRVEATVRALKALASGADHELAIAARVAPGRGFQTHHASDEGREIVAHSVTSEPGEDYFPRAAASPTSDVLLMERLIEASASRDLLLQELCSIVYENFSVEYLIIGKRDPSGMPEPIVCAGIELHDAASLCRRIDPSHLEAGGVFDLARIVHLSSPRGNGFDRSARSSTTFIYIRHRSDDQMDLDHSRLQPLVRQAELGLEACVLRAAAIGPAPIRVEQRVQTVMPGFIVGSPGMFEVVEKIHKIRTSDVTVLITGESGTGKELVARALHAESARARAIFLPFNCTATPRDLIESQLFGHRRGSFTGATTNYPGMVRAAEGGTLFLDEIGDVALEVQPKLMRFLQEGEIQPLGETRPIKVDVRVAAATNSDLERAVEEGRFREDLFHRLNIIRIHVPPLRERREEIPALASFFLDHFAARSGKPRLSLAQDAVDALTGYEWPGNVRQLRNEIERITAYASDNSRVSADDLTPEVTNGSKRRFPIAATRTLNAPAPGNNPEIGTASASPSKEHGSPIKLKDAVADLEARLIRDALARNRSNVSRTAFELGLSRRGLRLKLAQLGIDKE